MDNVVHAAYNPLRLVSQSLFGGASEFDRPGGSADGQTRRCWWPGRRGRRARVGPRSTPTNTGNWAEARCFHHPTRPSPHRRPGRLGRSCRSRLRHRQPPESRNTGSGGARGPIDVLRSVGISGNQGSRQVHRANDVGAVGTVNDGRLGPGDAHGPDTGTPPEDGTRSHRARHPADRVAGWTGAGGDRAVDRRRGRRSPGAVHRLRKHDPRTELPAASALTAVLREPRWGGAEPRARTALASGRYHGAVQLATGLTEDVVRPDLSVGASICLGQQRRIRTVPSSQVVPGVIRRTATKP